MTNLLPSTEVGTCVTVIILLCAEGLPLLCIKFCLITSNFAIIFDETKLPSYFVIKIFGQRRRDKSSSNVNRNA